MKSPPSARASQGSVSEPQMVPETVRWKLANCPKGAPLFTKSATEEDTESEEEVLVQHKHKTIKLGKVCKADSTVVRRITWPHELIYTARGQPVVYEQLTLPIFLTDYLADVDTMKLGLKEANLKHICELMVDADTYGWEAVHAYHTV